ncbi:hypothetical protein ABMA27_009813 [Loxostege sticticalis]|uniref:RNA-directed DNA polymerase n=1 Tax=Loxostege sticticalis TaxID=481309 RepID=A0ABR3H6J0_LOXSC
MAVNLSDEQFRQLLASLGSRRNTLASCSATFDGKKSSDAVETFLAAVRVYKKIENISDTDALDGLPLLLHGEAAVWWQGVKDNVSTWAQFEQKLRGNFAPKKPEYLIYHEIISERQEKFEDTATFIAKKRMLFSQLPVAEQLMEKQQLDLIYSLLNLRIRDKVPRNDVHNFEELIRDARGVEQVLQEKGEPIPVATSTRIKSKIRCRYCKGIGHSIEECRKRKSSILKENEQLQPVTTTNSKPQGTTVAAKVSCYGCGAPGVYRSSCSTCNGDKAEKKIEFCAVKVEVVTYARPTIYVNIGGQSETAFVDTCAKASVASFQLFDTLRKRGQVFNQQNVCITLADGVPRQENVCTFNAPLELCGRKFITNFIVLPHSVDNRTLLGIGFLKQAGIQLNLGQFTWSFLDNPHEEYELYTEDFVHFTEEKKNSPPRMINISALSPAQPVPRNLPSTTTMKLPAEPLLPPTPKFTHQLKHADLPSEAASTGYQLIPIDLPGTPPQLKRFKATVFDGYSPRLNYIMQDAIMNTSFDDSCLSPHSEDLFPTICNLPVPSNVKHLQTFLQTCSWYRRFIDNFSRIAEPLTRLTKKKAVWAWTEEQDTAYNKLKRLLTTAPVLKQADFTKPFILKTDASNYALGAVLVQGEGENEHPVEYASRLLTSAERNYSTTEKEALAVVWAINKFAGYIDGSPIIVVTDHQALKWLMSLKSPTGRLARWALQLQGFDITIKYTPGRTNVVADTLSRPPCTEENIKLCGICSVMVDMPIRSTSEVRDEQLKDDRISKIVNALEDDKKDEDAHYWSNKGYLLNNGLLYRNNPNVENDDAQLVVPQHEWANVLSTYHDNPLAGHYGSDKTYEAIAKRYYWTGMRKYIQAYVKNCVDCQRYKVNNQKPAGLLQTTAMNQRFEVLSFDLFGPLPESENGMTWVFIVEDLASRWVELFALDTATAENCALTLINEIFLRYGFPRRVISDNGTQFVSAVMQQVAFCMKIKHAFTPVYHPETNPVERRNRDLKTQLAILLGDNHRDWPNKLPCIRFAMNTAQSTSTNCSPAFLTFGRELKTLDDSLHNFREILISENFVPEITPKLLQLALTLERAKEVQEMKEEQRKEYVDQQRRRDPGYNIGDLVMVTLHPVSKASRGICSKFAPRRDGPYMVKRKHGPSSYEIVNPEDPNVSLGVYHSSALTAFSSNKTHLPEPVQALKRRGRPRKTEPKHGNGVQQKRGRGRPRKNTTH